MSLDTQFKQQMNLAEASPNWDEIPYPPPAFITTERLILRRHHMRDAPRLVEIANDKDVAENLAFPHPYTLDDAVSWITRSHTPDVHGTLPAIFCIVAKGADGDTAGGGLVGGIKLMGDGGVYVRNAELGYFLGRAYWGTGYVSEAAFALISHGFSGEWKGPLPLLRVWARVNVGNDASDRVLIRLGFREEGLLKSAVWKDGKAVDEKIMAITKQEWEGQGQESEEEGMDTDEEEEEEEEEEEYKFDEEEDDDDDDDDEAEDDKMETDELAKEKH
jgi:[ribosomal protein S5]-alanine N-acetyltransferase